ncbi:MAG: electron transport protein SCO1/SenC [Rhodocyclaceae bacterium]|nr:MAG: electron transport protein SCO1/SenC [Rhodocyclaceae bacterium]TND02056.1 MAG: electron transport protein SCO1/SenC [Rhodocyclaceae bacterium]
MNSTSYLLRSLAAAIAIALLTACSDSGTGERVLVARPDGGDFVLQSAAGPVDTRALRGNVLLIYFGYINCPDICPVSMAAGAAALNALTPAERGKTRMIMISVDPERDTPAKLKEYVAYFHPAMIGAVGTAAETAAIAKSFGVGYMRQPTRPDGGYAVDHSSQTFVIGPDGKLMELLPLGVATDKVVATVRKLL